MTLYTEMIFVICKSSPFFYFAGVHEKKNSVLPAPFVEA
jgi:hypothetical protein